MRATSGGHPMMYRIIMMHLMPLKATHMTAETDATGDFW